ncbi:MAG: class I SAM-dependent DNA methyltransferase [Acidithiobacillus ferrivorans]
MILPDKLPADQTDAFIARWVDARGSERSNYQLFLTELCTLLGLPQPDPAGEDTAANSYVFERRVDMAKPDGSVTRGYIDLYRRGSFILEAKQTGQLLDSHGWDKAMLAAHNQADQYLRALPAAEGRPPFIVVTDVGRSLELYAEFTRSGGTYVPYPDPGHHRIRLQDLRDPVVVQRLRQLWNDPDSLDPSRHAARVTRAIADRLARLAKSLEAAGHSPERVAHFLMRALFTMFAEDVGLLPQQQGRGAFITLLDALRERPKQFAPALQSLWQTMNKGGYDARLMATIQRFNGGLFHTPDVIPLNCDQIDLLREAASSDWRYVEPAIFGTLLERALDPRERHQLGAHYTPRAYVERLVMPTLINPLRAQWRTAQVAAETWLQQNKPDKALQELRGFHQQLCQIRVLDPPCGSGNFLYVALEHMKRLEGEVLNLIGDLNRGQAVLETQGLTVDPHQFLGLEINPRAAAIAEMVLWIGYLQWDYRIHQCIDLPEPILRDFHNIAHRDALLAYDGMDYALDEDGRAITRWDGHSYKDSPITGEPIPDESARMPVERYRNPRKARWPQADYIIGNPPFIGAANMRRALGDGYVDALRAVYRSEVPESADFVMYWWHIAAETVRHGQARRFGFITTNSIRQTFNRRVLEAQLNAAQNPLHLAFAIPDHPWVDAADGAAVRIAMTVGRAEAGEGVLLNVTAEQETNEDAHEVMLVERQGELHPDLTIGPNIAGAVVLTANNLISNKGFEPGNEGFIVTEEEALALQPSQEELVIHPYRNGRDLAEKPRGLMVIDLFGLNIEEARSRYPAIYQRLLERVKPERDLNRDPRLQRQWWLHRRSREDLRIVLTGLPRYVATVETAKHRVFQFLNNDETPSNLLICIAIQDALHLGILSSRVHVIWALATGGTLEDRPRYNKTRCFETYPFPDVTSEQAAHIRDLAEQLDAHRKRQQAEHTELTLTGMYNVLEKRRSGAILSVQDRAIHQAGLVSILAELHDALDHAVLDAYGWSDLADAIVGQPGGTTPLPDKHVTLREAEEEILTRLVALNTQRAAEEAQGQIRWLRPDYQAPDRDVTSSTGTLDLGDSETSGVVAQKPAWPSNLAEQIEVVRRQLAVGPASTDALTARFKRRPTKALTQVLTALHTLGFITHEAERWRLVS